MAEAELRSVLIGVRERDFLVALLEKIDSSEFDTLYEELDAATVVADGELPPDVVRMHARVTYLDCASGQASTIKLVYPGETSDDGLATVSVLAPVGAALIGLREGETIAWPMPQGGSKTLKVIKVDSP